MVLCTYARTSVTHIAIETEVEVRFSPIAFTLQTDRKVQAMQFNVY